MAPNHQAEPDQELFGVYATPEKAWAEISQHAAVQSTIVCSHVILKKVRQVTRTYAVLMRPFAVAFAGSRTFVACYCAARKRVFGNA